MRVHHWQACDAESAVKARRIVAFGAAAGGVVQAEGAGAALCGVAGRADAAAKRRIEIARIGVAEVEYGGAVARGDLLTADSEGKAVALTAPGIFQAVVAGAAADSDIAVSGIKTADILIGVAATDKTAASGARIESDGKVQTDTDLAGKTVIVAWRRPVHVIGAAETAGAGGDVGEVLLNPHAL